MGKRGSGTNGESNVVSLVPGTGGDEGMNWDYWHIPARGPRGHSDRIQCRVAPQLLGQLQKAFQSGNYPYKSIGFMYRHALVRHLNWLREHPEYEDGVGSTINAIHAMIKTLREEDFMDEFRSLFEKLDDTVGRHRAQGEVDHARKLVMSIWGEVRGMEDDFWKGQYEGELQRRYRDLLSQGEGGGDDG